MLLSAACLYSLRPLIYPNLRSLCEVIRGGNEAIDLVRMTINGEAMRDERFR